MKVILPTIAAIICLIILIAGNLQWKEKTKVSSFLNGEEVTTNEATNPTEENQRKEPDVDISLVKNWPEPAQATFKKAMQEGKQYKVALFGSQALGSDNGWANQLKNAMEEAYEKDNLQVLSFSFNKTSYEVVKEKLYKEMTNEKPDLVLFEPFTLNDNGVVEVPDNHKNILKVINGIKKENDQAVVILQPTNPISGGDIYTEQVQQLASFAKENDIPYLDHWTVWPDRLSTEMKEYLNDKGNPNEKGHKVWFEFLKKYFIAE